MCELRERVKALMRTKGVSQADLIRRMIERGNMKVDSSVVSQTMTGGLMTPKACRILEECEAILLEDE